MCTNCTTRKLSCVYSENFRSFIAATNKHREPATSSASRDASITPSTSSSSLEQRHQDEENHYQKNNNNQSLLNMDHLELFHHFVTEITSNFVQAAEHAPESPSPSPNPSLRPRPSLGLSPSLREIITKAGLSTPYLMHQMLSLSALHLSIIQPPGERQEQQQHQRRRAFYRDQAAQLQSRAISMFNSAKAEATDDNCVALLLFSSLLGTHVFCDMITYREAGADDFNAFLDQFVNYLRLHRAVRVVAGKTWSRLQQTELKPLLDIMRSVPRTKETRGLECSGLVELVEASSLDSSSIHACREAVDHLQWVFDGVGMVGDANLSTSMTHTWPVTLTEEYTGLLAQRKPEALVILAYFGVLLHHHRQSWFFGDGGRFLIESITGYLGPYWEKWLVWPNEVLKEASRV